MGRQVRWALVGVRMGQGVGCDGWGRECGRAGRGHRQLLSDRKVVAILAREQLYNEFPSTLLYIDYTGTPVSIP